MYPYFHEVENVMDLIRIGEIQMHLIFFYPFAHFQTTKIQMFFLMCLMTESVFDLLMSLHADHKGCLPKAWQGYILNIG